MEDKKFYKNGELAMELKGETMTYYYLNGRIRATGPFIDGHMEGEWIFYRETGQLWQIASFKEDLKHGRWIRYNRDNKVEYDKVFENNKIIKQ